ncbi:hypothetical protein KO481_16405 [Nocardia sp. NEAU-G5]|uniref:Roadblock/LAMTOR2 domain-containing protein n=1 Tax=Nocardia albiluteola TaxID=2842303 RepID=A0ABS6B1J8_9NOCA|nr:hypothetical protein [Nocardia albiluteola]MBU3063103.1 hypothetical protein [Nocardia albiluteola]
MPISIEAARGLAEISDGLVLVLLRDQQVVGVLHVEEGAADAVGAAATTVLADQAVVVVIATLKAAGRLILLADQMRKILAANGVEVTASVHVPSLKPGARWTDLALVDARDGILGRMIGRRRR